MGRERGGMRGDEIAWDEMGWHWIARDGIEWD